MSAPGISSAVSGVVLTEAVGRLRVWLDGHPVRPDTLIHGPAGTLRVSDVRAVVAAADTSDRLAPVMEALASIDAANAACPVQAAPSCPERCPKCGATDSQNCGPNVRALDALEAAVRAALTDTSERPAMPQERSK